MKYIIVNADDFGSSPSVNKAIIKLFNNGLINSTTLMANMMGFDEAIELAHSNKIINKIGAHLVLSEGTPLTKEMESAPDFFSMDSNARKKFKQQIFLSKEKQVLIYKEYSKQIEKLRKNGIPVNHLDSHHHMHEMWGIMQILLELLKVYHIPKMRILLNLETNKIYKNAYRNLLNNYLKQKKVNYSDYFGSRVDFLNSVNKNPGKFNNSVLEIMVHPAYNLNGEIIDVFPNSEYDFNFLKTVQEFLFEDLVI